MLIQTVMRRVILSNADGLHLRAAAVLAQKAGEFRCDIQVLCGKRAADAKSVLDLLILAAESGTDLNL